YGDSIWNPSTHLDYKPDSTTGLYSLASCSSSGSDTPCTGGALPPNTALIGDTPTAPADNSTSSAKHRAAAEKALKDAQDAQRNVQSKLASKREASEKAWKEVREVAPKSLDAYNKKIMDNFNAKKKLEDAMKHFAVQPTPENLQAFGQAAATAAESEATASQAYDSLKASLPFDLATRLDWTGSEYENALNGADQADAAVRSAEEDADFWSSAPAPTPPAPTPPAPTPNAPTPNAPKPP